MKRRIVEWLHYPCAYATIHIDGVFICTKRKHHFGKHGRWF